MRNVLKLSTGTIKLTSPLPIWKDKDKLHDTSKPEAFRKCCAPHHRTFPAPHRWL